MIQTSQSMVTDNFSMSLDDCPYASGAHSTILVHRRKFHIHEQKDKPIKQVAVQSLFSGLGLKYFIVSPTLREQSPNSAFSTLISKVLPQMPELHHPTPARSRDILPLHRVTRWWDILGPHALNKNSRKSIITLVGPVGKEEEGLSALPHLCEEYLLEAQKAAKSAGFTVRKRLVPEE